MPAPPGFDRIVNRTAELFGVLLLALLTGLVFLNASTRYLFSHSFIWGDELIIAIIPWVAMSGLFLAVRRRNVIRIDFFVDKFWPGPRKVLRLAGDLLSAIVFVYLAWVSVEYVQSVRRRPVGLSALADGPVQLFLRDRAAACRVGLSRHVLARSAGRRRSCARPRGPRPMTGALLSIVLLLGLLVLGVPMLVALLAAVVLNFFLSGQWPLTLPQTMISGVSSFTLIALPLFVLAGTIMNAGGISGRLFEFARALVGWLRGGLAQVDVLTSIFFGGMIGSSTADLAGTGSITIPALKRQGYPAEIAASVTASSSGIGPLIPPSSPMILYSAITGVSLGSLFLAGLVPGILLGLVLMGVVAVLAHRRGWPRHGRFSLREIWKTGLRSLLSFGMPAAHHRRPRARRVHADRRRRVLRRLRPRPVLLRLSHAAAGRPVAGVRQCRADDRRAPRSSSPSPSRSAPASRRRMRRRAWPRSSARWSARTASSCSSPRSWSSASSRACSSTR